MATKIEDTFLAMQESFDDTRAEPEQSEPLQFAPPPADIGQNAEPRCLRCGYFLRGLTEPRCPECGRAFHPSDQATFTWKPPLLRWRLWAPGLGLAVSLALLQSGLLIYAGSFGWALTLVVPLVAGTVLGYGVRAKWFIITLLSLLLLSATFFGLMSASLAGVYCGLILAGIFLGPILVGAVGGVILRQLLKRSRFSQGPHLPTLGLIVSAIVPVLIGLAEPHWHGQVAVRTINTSLVLDAPPRRVWDALLFFGDVKAEPPWLAEVGLPHAVRVEGNLGGVGDSRRCVYSKGYLVKKVTAWQPHQRLGFKVTAQHRVETRSAELKGGAFHLTPIANGTKTRLRLTTKYRPLLQARTIWSPLERATVHVLHKHVLRGVRRQLDHPKQASAMFREAKR